MMDTPTVPYNLARCAELFAARADIEDDLACAFAGQANGRINRGPSARLAILDRDIASILEAADYQHLSVRLSSQFLTLAPDSDDPEPA